MPKFYRVHAFEPETITHYYQDPVASPDVAADDAEDWASHYYGSDAATWSIMEGTGRYLVGRINENGDRSPVSCIITAEEYVGD